MHFFQNGTRCPCPSCLSSLAGETVKYKYPGQKQHETHYGDSGEGAIVKKLHQRADVRKGRGHDYKRDPTHHSSIYTLIRQTWMTCLLFARNEWLVIQRWIGHGVKGRQEEGRGGRRGTEKSIGPGRQGPRTPAEECKLCSIGDEEPSNVFTQEVAPISTPPHYLPSQALTCFSHSTYYNLEIFIHLSV